jgi:hypothetical protein
MKMNYEDIENRVFVKKYELQDLTPSNITKFVIDNLFEEQEPLNFDSYEFNREDSTRFEPILHINSKEYRISKAVQKEIYNSLKFLIEEINSLDPWDINIVEANLDAKLTIAEKIDYLKEKRKELYLGVQNEPEYYVYTGKREFNGFDNWEELIFDLLLHQEIVVVKYLTNDLDIPDIPKTIYDDWHKYYKTKELISICEKKIKELSEGNEVKNEEIDFKKPSLHKTIDIKINSDIIFKENYDRLFNYIVISYSDKKNKAFFSYLYHFFSDNTFLLKNKKSSVPYNKYLVCNNYIDKFSKVIQRDSENSKNSDEEKRMFEIFKTYYLKFIQIEVEGKLKEN